MRDFTRSGAVMKAFREQLGMTQTEFGKQFGMSEQYCSNAERSHCLPPAHAMKLILKRNDFPKFDFVSALSADLIESQMMKYQEVAGRKLTVTQQRNKRYKNKAKA